MTRRQTVFAVALDEGSASDYAPKALRCLVIGVPGVTFPEGSVKSDQVASIRYDELSRYCPFESELELIVAPLFCAEFDALEIIEELGSRGYRNALRIVAPKLPNRQIVLRELRTHAVRQGITLDIVEMA